LFLNLQISFCNILYLTTIHNVVQNKQKETLKQHYFKGFINYQIIKITNKYNVKLKINTSFNPALLMLT